MNTDDPSSLPPELSSTNNPKVEDGKLVQRRAISTAYQAQSIADGLVLDDVGRDCRRAENQRALNGASPFSEKTLREKNQSHRFNVSFGYLEGVVGRAIAPYLDMGLDEETVAKINADLDETKKNIIRDQFVKTVRAWGMWPRNYNALAHEAVSFGYCSAIFPNPNSPWWHVAKQRDGLTFARAMNIASQLDVFVWKRSYLIHELYDHVADKAAAETAGWNVDNVWEALTAAAPDDYTKNRLMGGRQIYEEAIRAAALAISYGRGAKKIYTYHVYCKELSGKVSQWIVIDSSGGSNSPSNEVNNPASPPNDAIRLFYQYEQFPSMESVVTRFDFEYGDGYWHGAKGLAQKLYGVHKTHDRLMCSGLDQTFRGGLGVLKSSSEKAHSAASIIVTSDNVILPPDLEATPGVKMPTLQPEFFSMDAAVIATAVQRGGDVAPEAMGVERPAKTATQSSIDQSQKQVITKSNMKRWVPALSSVIDTMLKRLLNPESGDPDAIKFTEALLLKGITPEDIKKVRKAEVFHTIEDVFGETRQNISYISDKYRADPDIDRIQLKQREIGTWLGPQSALELCPGDSDELDKMKASRQQTLEISAMLDGNAVPVAPDDLHPIHVATIANKLKDIAQKIISGQTQATDTPNDQDIVNLLAHAEEHIKFEGAEKGNRESARALEAMMQESIAMLGQAKQIAAQKHAQALQVGLQAGLLEGSKATASGPASPSAAPASPSTPEQPPAPEPSVMAA